MRCRKFALTPSSVPARQCVKAYPIKRSPSSRSIRTGDGCTTVFLLPPSTPPASNIGHPGDSTGYRPNPGVESGSTPVREILNTLCGIADPEVLESGAARHVGGCAASGCSDATEAASTFAGDDVDGEFVYTKGADLGID